MKVTAQTAGDIAIIGLNRGGGSSTSYPFNTPFELVIVVLKDIPASTTIYISDYGWNGTAFTTTSNVNEGAITWTTPPAIIPAGNVYLIKITGGSTLTISGLPGTVTGTGWTGTPPANCPVSAGGDNWFIYRGTNPTTPTDWIYGWTNYGTVATGGANEWLAPGGILNINTSYLPSQLTNGTTARSLAWLTANGGSHGDNNVYTGIQVGTQAQLLAAIGTVSNWSFCNELDQTNLETYRFTSVSVGTTTHAGNPFFNGANPVFTVLNSTLPVRLLSFDAQLQQGNVLLTWKTADAVNFSHFEIEKSPDGGSFSVISRQAPVQQPGEAAYSYTDINAGADANRLFYRLKMTDTDGSFTYSKVVVVNAGVAGTVRVTGAKPNPFTDNIIVGLDMKEKAPVVLQLLDMTGRIMASKKIIAAKGMSNQSLDGLGHLVSGTYLLRVQAGNEEVTRKVMKQ